MPTQEKEEGKRDAGLDDENGIERAVQERGVADGHPGEHPPQPEPPVVPVGVDVGVDVRAVGKVGRPVAGAVVGSLLVLLVLSASLIKILSL